MSLAGSVRAQSPTSFELTVEDKTVTAAAEDYKKGLEKYSQASADTIGFVFAINGKLNSGDVYASPELFGKMYAKLLHAAAVEAFAEREPNADKIVYDSPTPETVEALIKSVDNARGEPQPMDAMGMEMQINRQIEPQKDLPSSPQRTVMLKKQTEQVEMHETIDTQTKAPFLHRAYLTK